MLPIFVLAMGACERRPVSTTPEAAPSLVVVDGTPLTQREFQYFLPEDPYALSMDERKGYLDRWITTQLLYDAEMETGQGMTEAVQARLDQYRRDLIADQLVQRVIETRATVSEEEIQGYYDAHAREYTTEYRVSHILVNTSEDANEVRAQVGKRSFEYLARKHSIDKHSRYGGDLGYLSKGNMIPEFEDIVFSMEVGDVSDVIESDFGYHIVKINDIREARFKLSYEDVRSEIANILMLEKREAVYDSLVASLWESARIEYTAESERWIGEVADTLSLAE